MKDVECQGPEEHALFSTLCRALLDQLLGVHQSQTRSGRHLHRHLGFFEPVDFVRFARGRVCNVVQHKSVWGAVVVGLAAAEWLGCNE